MLQDVQNLDDQEPAVGPVDGAGPDHGEIGEQGAELSLSFDGSEQVGESGVGFENNRRPLQFAVVHEHIDFVTGQIGLSGGHGQGKLRDRAFLPEVIDVLDNILFHLFQIGLDVLAGLVLFLEFLDVVVETT